MIEDLYRNHARLVGDVATDHQHHTEFTHGVGETENAGGDETGARQHHMEETVPRAGAQGGRDLQRALADGGKAFCNGWTTKGME